MRHRNTTESKTKQQFTIMTANKKSSGTKLLILRIIVLAAILTPVAVSVLGRARERKVQQRHDHQVDSVMQTLSIREKVAQLFMIEVSRFPSERTKAYQDSLIKEFGIGGIILMRGPIGQFIERKNELQSASAIPLLVSTDAEWGAAMRFQEYRPYPRQALLGRIEKGEKLLYRMGRNVGAELRDLGIHMNLAPVADICPDPYNESDGQRSFGGDRELVASYACAYMKGMQDEGVFSCAKHYPGHGDTYVDSHYALPVLPFDRHRLDSLEFYPFKRLIDEGIESIMVAHLSIPAIDSTGVPMSISSKCMVDLLRGEQGFKGLIMTDAVGMKGVAEGRSAVEVNTLVYKAGSDLILMPDDVKESICAIADSVETGVWSEEELNAKVRRVLELKARAGLFDRDYNPIVDNLDEKISRAARRDSTLQVEISKAMARSRKPPITPIGQDGTLVLDRAGK